MRLNGAQHLVGLVGVYDVVHKDKEGNLKSRTLVDNTVTSVGKKRVAYLIAGNATAVFKRLAIGSSATAAVVGNTTLAAEITSPSLARTLATSTQVTTTVTDDTHQLVHTYTSTATQAVQEVGVFDSASSGNMISRTTFTAKNLTSGDTLQVTHKLIVA